MKRLFEKLATSIVIGVLATSAVAVKIQAPGDINNFHNAVQYEISVATGIVPTSRQILAGTGLTGGGDLTSDRTLSLDLTSPNTWTGAATFSAGLSGTLTGNVTGNVSGSAATLATPRLIGTLTGDVTSAGSNFNGSAANTNAATLASSISGAKTFSTSLTTPSLTVTDPTAGGTVNALHLTNTGTQGAGTAVGISLDPRNAGIGVRDAQIVSSITTAGATASLHFRIANGVAPTDVWVMGVTSDFYCASCTAPNVAGQIAATRFIGPVTGAVTGNASTATALATPRLIGTLTGDVTSAGSNFDGSAANTNATTLATVNSNVGACGVASTSYPIVTLDAKGRTTACTTQALGTAAFAATGASGHTLPYLDVSDTFSSAVTFSGGLVSSGANTFANTGSNFVIGGSVSASRSVTFNDFGQPTFLYNDNSAGATLGTLNNFSISGSGQGASIGTFNFGTGGVSGGQAGLLRILTTDTWATAANRSSLFQLDLIYQNSVISKAIAYDPAAGFWVGGHQVMPAMPVTMGGSTYATDADYAPVLAALAAIVNLTGTITANRTFTLPACQTGQSFRIVRTGAGAFTWTIGSKTLAQNQWIDEYCESSTFIETAFGSL